MKRNIVYIFVLIICMVVFLAGCGEKNRFKEMDKISEKLMKKITVTEQLTKDNKIILFIQNDNNEDVMLDITCYFYDNNDNKIGIDARTYGLP